MYNQDKIKAFLTLNYNTWDPTLICVMISAFT